MADDQTAAPVRSGLTLPIVGNVGTPEALAIVVLGALAVLVLLRRGVGPSA